MSVATKLESALAAIERGEDEAAIGALVAAWRERPAAELAGLPAVAERRLGALALEGKTALAKREAWLARAKEGRVAELGRLAESLDFGRNSRQAVECLEALEPALPDPRLSALLERALRTTPFTANSAKPFWVKVFALIERSADPRLLELAEEISQGWKVREALRVWLVPTFRKAAQRLRERLGEESPPLGEAERALVERLAAALAPTGPAARKQEVEERAIEALLAEVYEHPDDDGPRLVLADALQERGDPWGELIALQLQPSLSPAQQRRVRALLKEHERDWIGPIAPVITKGGAVFRRGFLSACKVIFRNRGQVDAYGSLPAWATVEEIDFSTNWSDSGDGFSQYLDPAMRSLRVVKQLSEPGFRNLCRGSAPWPIEEISGSLWSWPVCSALARCELLPRLRSLRLTGQQVRPGGLDWLWGAPFAGQLRRLVLTDQHLGYHLGAWLDEAGERPGLEELVLAEGGDLSAQKLWGWVIEARRDAMGALTALRISRPQHPAVNHDLRRSSVEQLARTLGALDEAALTRVEVASTKEWKLTAEELELIASSLSAQRRLAALDLDGELREPTLRPAAGTEAPIFRLEEAPLPRWSEDQRLLAQAAAVERVALAVEKGALVLELVGEEARPLLGLGGAQPVGALSLSPAGDLIALAARREVSLWSVEERRERVRLTGHRGRVRAVAFSRDGGALLTADEGGCVSSWALDGARRWTAELGATSALALALLPDGAVAVGTSDGTVSHLDGATGALLERRTLSPLAITALGASPDGALLAAATLDGVLLLLDPGGGPARELARLDRAITSLRFDGPARRLAVAAAKSIWLFEVGPAEAAKPLFCMGHDACFRPDGTITVATNWGLSPFDLGTMRFEKNYFSLF